jgi:outer membrane protein OmpA-like peptidoglycan-associated protein
MKYLKNYENYNSERIDEGVKEWMLAGLITLSSFAGLSQAPKRGDISKDDIKKAELVQQKIEDGDSTILNLFNEVDIIKNKENLEKLKSVDVSKVDVIKTPSKKRAKSLIKSGYTMLSIEEIKDTIVSFNDEIKTGTKLTLTFDSDVAFETAGYNLSDDYKTALVDTLDYLLSRGSDIKMITIESSTDKEPISIGNEKLAKLRSDGVYKELEDLGLSDNVEVKNLPNQGPDIYTKVMSKEERSKAREKTADFRYVKIVIELEEDVKPAKSEKVIEVLDKYKMEFIRPVQKAMEKPKKPGRSKVEKKQKIESVKKGGKKEFCGIDGTKCYF